MKLPPMTVKVRGPAEAAERAARMSSCLAREARSGWTWTLMKLMWPSGAEHRRMETLPSAMCWKLMSTKWAAKALQMTAREQPTFEAGPGLRKAMSSGWVDSNSWEYLKHAW